MIKKHLPILILAAIYFIGELYQSFSATDTSNWIWLIKRPMSIQWNVKFLSEEINWFLAALFCFIVVRRCEQRENELVIATRVFLWWRFFDIILYFINYKTEKYEYIFVLLILIELYMKYRHKNKTK